ncbi:MAG: hypothetical protein JW850_09850 [Thermoflexales bacterium]|nr:hypothetical protein [Thermoflexales bacterium]
MRATVAKSKTIALIALVVLVLPNLAVGGASAIQASGLTMTVEPHYSGHFKFGEWLPLRVTLANDGPAVRAELRADTSAAGGRTIYVAPVELPSGARKRLTLYVQPPSFAQAVRVRLVEGERELASQAAKLSLERNINYLVGIAAPRTEPFAALNGVTLGKMKDEGQWGGMMPSMPRNPRPLSTIPVRLSDIPDRVEGLRVLDALVISGLDTSELSEEQRHALHGWVEGGGRLILGGGAGAARTLAGMPAELVRDWLPLGETEDVPALGALGEFAAQTVRVPGPFAVTWLAEDAAPLYERYSLVEQDGHTLVLDRRFGEGYVNYVALDLAGSPFDAWAGAARFWEKLVEPGSSYPSYAPQDVSLRLMQANSMSYALQNLPTLELPSIRWLAGLLAVYIVLVGPANYVLLRRLRKLEWGWITIAALTLLFSAGAFAMGFSMRGGDVIVNKISILNLGAGGTAAPMRTYVGIFSPERRAYTVDLPGGGLASPVSMEEAPIGWGGGMSTGGALEIVQGEPAQVRGVQVDQWTMQMFSADSLTPAGWEIEADLDFEGERLRGTLVNRTSETVLDAAIVYGSRFARIGELPPGQSVRIDHVLTNPSESAFPYFLYEHIWQQAGSAGPSRELQVRQQVLENYYNQFKMSPQAPSQPTLIGWLRASPFDVQVSGVRWATQQTSLVISPLRVDYLAGSIHLPAGSVPVSLLGVYGDASTCGSSPSYVYLDMGTAILEFRLPAEAVRVTSLALVIKNDGPIPTVELYERDDEWVELEAPQSGPNAIANPDRFVLGDGTIRVRLSNTGGNWGGCSRYDLEVEGMID